MKFGLFLELIPPRPFTAEIEHHTFMDAVEQTILAEELGFDQVWVVEHHFLDDYSHSTSPETFLGYLAAKTSMIRLGHGIRSLLPNVNHPVRAAEMGAFVDQMSGGRLEFGSGRQTTWTELNGFGVSPDESRLMWEDSIRTIVDMWCNHRDFSHRSRYFETPPRAILPRTLQKPHPPLWLAVNSPETAAIAGQLGLGFLGSSFSEPAKYRSMIDDYRAAIAGCVDPIGAAVHEEVNGTTFMYCAPTDEEGLRDGMAGALAFFEAATTTLGVAAVFPSMAYDPRSGRYVATAPRSRPDMPIGSPETCIAALRRWEDIGIDRMCMIVSVADLPSQDRVLASLRLFAREVMPAFEGARRLASIGEDRR